MENRTAHVIKPNHKAEIPQNLIFFDTETIEIIKEHEGEIEGEYFEDKELVLKLGVACYWKRGRKDMEETVEWKDFTKINEFWDFVFSKLYGKQKIYLIAHNVAFDIRVVKGFQYLKENGYSATKLIYNGTTNIWDFKNGSKSICIMDNMNFFKSKLKTLGESVKLDKMDMPTNDDKKLLEYCTRDVEIMIAAWELFFKFLKDNNLGNFQRTIASQAFSSYRHRFMRNKIYIHNNEFATKLERESYHGGRTECFYIGTPRNGRYYLLDVVSMYPSVMETNDYPSKLIRVSNKPCSIIKMDRMLDSRCVTARVLLETDKPIYATYYNDKLMFPVGSFITTLTTRELIKAINEGHLKQVFSYSVYEKKNLFKSYVDFFYSKKAFYKDNGDEAFTYMTKLFLNSLYGKFGQRVEEVIEKPFPKSWNKKEIEDGVFQYYDKDDVLVTERRINGKIYESRGIKKESYNSFAGIAAHITADARIKLWEYFEMAGLNNIYYSDTDSMIVNKKGLENCEKAIIPELGFLELKDETNHIEIYAAKDYVFGKNEVIKGIRKDAKKITKTKFEQVKFEGFKGALRKGHLNEMHIGSVTKQLKRNYNKGTVLTNGRVEPFKITPTY